MSEEDPLDEAHGHVAGVATGMIRGAEALARRAQQNHMTHAQVSEQLTEQQRERYNAELAQRAAWLQDRSDHFNDWWDGASSFTRAQVYEATQRSEATEPDRLGPPSRELATKIEDRTGVKVDGNRDLGTAAIIQRRDRIEMLNHRSIGADKDTQRMKPELAGEAIQPRMQEANKWAADRNYAPGDGLTVYHAWLADRTGLDRDGDYGRVAGLAAETEYFRDQSETEQTQSTEADRAAQSAATPEQQAANQNTAKHEQVMADQDGEQADHLENATEVAWDSEQRRDQLDAELAANGVNERAREAHRHAEYGIAYPPQQAAQAGRQQQSQSRSSKHIPSPKRQAGKGRGNRGPGR